MDLNTVTQITAARHRDDLRLLGPGVVPLAGGSELFADPRVELTGLVDLTTLGWPALTVTDDGGLEIAATCTLAELAAFAPLVPASPASPARAGESSVSDAQSDDSPALAGIGAAGIGGSAAAGWAAHPLLYQCCTALFGSFKIWNVATVGGNLATALPAGPMITLAVALDAELLIWRGGGTGGGTDERVPAVTFVTGNMTTILAPTDVLRSIHVSANALASRTAFRKIALSPIGRSGAVLAGRLAPGGGFTLTVTGGTLRPVLLAYSELPPATTLAADIAAIDCWFTDAHGAADWRRAVSGVLGEEIRLELSGDQTGARA
ncbi:FAD-binding molybdopterin dehydrogenase [Cryobacterium frigoriphilum]|uniref:FAD-binding molybdopterin dehydrogenase n=1 Tax=Cryobacterium frigoriphilum TaxID=1259150 RepID=A0A4V3IQK8_9MICO|nr:FAD binding domain-containing protein [Cryobacterium frigoriphilum]TFD47289.1 FAD-binding molybdopterin dehydrogenase [Cryobacterium frigoriphilum]